MIHYLDTSALVKKYFFEEHSETVQKIIQDSKLLITSALTELEMTSWLERSKRCGMIDSPAYRKTLSDLEKDFRRSGINLVVISDSILLDAKRMIRQRKLRAPDAIQLASALQAKKRFQSHLKFICFDIQLNEAAKLEGLT